MAFLESEGYTFVRVIPGQGICGLCRMAYTVGLFIGMDEYGYNGRYCFHELNEAREAIITWTGKEDPPGEWIKYNGVGGARLRIPDPIDT